MGYGQSVRSTSEFPDVAMFFAAVLVLARFGTLRSNRLVAQNLFDVRERWSDGHGHW